jgi:hypothetical protein
MSFEEKSTWIFAVIVVIVPGAYLATVFGQLQQTAVTEIAYQAPMLTAIGIAIALAIVAHIVVAIASPKDADKHDERDTNINRYGEYVGSLVLWPGALVALGLALAELEHFWIAHTIYLAFVLSGLVSSVVKILAYRRGFSSW